MDRPADWQPLALAVCHCSHEITTLYNFALFFPVIHSSRKGKACVADVIAVQIKH